MTWRAQAAALALPVLFAAVVLASAAANRRDARGPTILTEREVSLGFRSDDRSVPELWLSWSEPAGPFGAWLTRDALGALGFDVSVDAGDPQAEVHYARQLARRAFVAFEFDGPAWQAVLDDRARTEPPGAPLTADDFRRSGSRLVPVDVALDPAVLVRRYPDPQRHLITAAAIGVRRYETAGGAPYVGSALIDVDPRRIQVPVDQAADLPPGRIDERERPRFRVSLMYGRRWEPWVADVSRGDASR